MTSSMPTSYAPNEPGALLTAERDALLSGILGGAGFGIVLTLYLLALSLLLNRNWKKHKTLLILSSLLFVCAVLLYMAATRQIVNAFTTFRDYPGGPIGFVKSSYADSGPGVVGNPTYVIQSWLSDGFLIYRCYIVYGRRIWVIIVPCLFLLGSVVTSCFVLSNEMMPNSSFWSRTSVNFAVPYYSLTITLNALVTLLITGKLLLARRRSQKALGTHFASNEFVSVSAMLIESAALNCFTSIAFVIPYARGYSISIVFQEIAAYNATASTLLIIVRVAQGRAWQMGTTEKLSSLRFSSNIRPPDSTVDSQDDTLEERSMNRSRHPVDFALRTVGTRSHEGVADGAPGASDISYANSQEKVHKVTFEP